MKDKGFRKAVEKALEETEDLDLDDAIDSLESGEVIMEFDAKTFHLLHCEINGVRFTAEVEDNGVTVKAGGRLDAEIDYFDFGKIDEDDVAVPKSVRKNAEEESSGGFGNLIDGTEPAESQLPGSEETPLPEPAEVVPPDIQSGADVTGAYNGVAFANGAGDWAATFGADGWDFDIDCDGEYSFAVAENSGYKDVDLYVYSKDYMNGNTNASTAASVKKGGFWGYSISAAYAKAKPGMTWNGLTFGASKEDVLAAYGEPEYTYSGSLYTSYEYAISDSVDMTFYIYHDSGLQDVKCNVWL